MGSRDGFTPNKFHALCDNIPYTVTFIKIKDQKKLLEDLILQYGKIHMVMILNSNFKSRNKYE